MAKNFCFALLTLVLFTFVSFAPQQALAAKGVVKSYKATAKLPKNLKWATNEEAPFSSPLAKRGGTFRAAINSFPLTFRLYGPNSASGGFVGYNRNFTMWGLTTTHPNSLKIIPLLATHWAVMKDNKTVYYKLDQDAKWSDGVPITADDYLFAFDFMRSKHIQAPFYNQYARDHFASVEKVDDHTIKMVSVKPSWRVLYEMDINPLPRHWLKLNEKWVKAFNWKPNVTAGPYVLSKFKKGKSIIFSRVKDWWGKDKARFKGLYNFDRYYIKVIRTQELEFELFKKGKLDLFTVGDGARWAKQTDFKAIQKGWVLKQKIYSDSPAGVRGVFFNLQDPILKDRRIRQALNHSLDFKTINEKYLYRLEKRQIHFFDVFPPYRDPQAKAPTFDLKKANRLLDQADWKQRNDQGIRTKGGQPLKITISFGNNAWTKHLTFFKETAKKAGILINLKKLDGAALYKSFNERSYQALVLVYGGGPFPNPRQYLHSENVRKGTNNLFQFSDKKVDQWIEIYEYDLNEKKRIKAIFNIEKTLRKERVMIQFWRKDHERLLWWRDIQGPKGFISKTGLSTDVLWKDSKLTKELKAAKSKGKALSKLKPEADPYHLH